MKNNRYICAYQMTQPKKMKRKMLKIAYWGGVIFLLSACTPNQELSLDQTETSTASQAVNAASGSSDTDTSPVSLLPGMWRLAGQFDSANPSMVYSCYGDPFVVASADSLHLYTTQYVAPSMAATPTLQTTLTAAYRYMVLSPSTLLVGSDTVTLSPHAQGLRLCGPTRGAILTPYNPQSHE